MEKTINLLMEYCEYGDLSLFMKKNFSKKENNPLIGPWKGFNEYIVLEFLFQLGKAILSFLIYFFFFFFFFFFLKKNYIYIY